MSYPLQRMGTAKEEMTCLGFRAWADCLDCLGAGKESFRIEGGDWKQGSVYVYVVNEEGFVLFHGGDVSREDRMLDLEMEDRNGVKFIREIMAAGAAGGGYVEYYWDNPAVEGDEVTGSRKIGYAEGFRLREGGQVFIVGSGIYAPDR